MVNCFFRSSVYYSIFMNVWLFLQIISLLQYIYEWLTVSSDHQFITVFMNGWLFLQIISLLQYIMNGWLFLQIISLLQYIYEWLLFLQIISLLQYIYEWLTVSSDHQFITVYYEWLTVSSDHQFITVYLWMVDCFFRSSVYYSIFMNGYFLQIIFEAERGKSVSGEIGLDHVLLISGPCSDEIWHLLTVTQRTSLLLTISTKKTKDSFSCCSAFIRSRYKPAWK